MAVLLGWGFLALAPARVHAHDFWIAPHSHVLAQGQAATLTFQVGHPGAPERSQLPRHRIRRLDVVQPGAATAEVKLLPVGELGDAIVKPGAVGLAVVALATDETAYSRLPADLFNAHVRAEGLTPALLDRRRTGREGAPAVERYGRRAKTLIHMGARGDVRPDDGAAPVGLSLEIVPSVNPFAIAPGGTLPLRIIYEGQLLEGALVQLKSLDAGGPPVQAQRTDSGGAVEFRSVEPGAWLVTTAWTRRLADDASADFETVFSSLSFSTEDVSR